MFVSHIHASIQVLWRNVGYKESNKDTFHTNKLKLNESLTGECISLKDGDYRCECTGTGYYGETCHKGEEADVDVECHDYVNDANVNYERDCKDGSDAFALTCHIGEKSRVEIQDLFAFYGAPFGPSVPYPSRIVLKRLTCSS